MKRFALLYRELDASTATREKQAALQRYLQDAPALDAAWAVYFLAGGKPRQTVPTRQLRELARDLTGLPEWLFEESYQTVGDLAETVSLLLPPASAPVERGLAEWLTQHLLPLRGLAPELLAERLRAQWDSVPDDQRFVYFKLITGGFRVGVSKLLVTQALAAVGDVLLFFSVDVVINKTAAASIPNSSATSWRIFVFSPWPISVPPVDTCTLPSV